MANREHTFLFFIIDVELLENTKNKKLIFLNRHTRETP